jgi:subtilisin family serine protease
MKSYLSRGLAAVTGLAVIGLAAAVVTLHSEPAQTRSAKIGWSLDRYQEQPSQAILVVLKDQADLSGARDLQTPLEKRRFVYEALLNKAKNTQGNLVQRLEGQFHYQQFYISNMIAVFDATPALIEELAARPDVARIIANKSFRAVPARMSLFSLENPAGVNDSITATGADKVWAQFTKGQGIVVAGQDTGVEWDHPALMAHYRGYNGGQVDHNYNWHDAIHGDSKSNPCGDDTVAPCDDNEHGTHTMGTVVGDDGANAQIGMAPGAQWIACRNMDQGVGTPARYIECFEFFLAPYPLGKTAMDGLGDPSKAPDVINNSWGCPASEGCEGEEILPALQAMKAAGIMVVASAGNDGPGCSTIHDQPAQHSSVTLSVGAYDHRAKVIAGFSSRGPSAYDGLVGPDVVAPGVNILSSVPGHGYAQFGWSGTSMAGPHVVGTVALMWAAQPKLRGQIEETTALIEKTATPKTTTESCGGVAGSVIPNNTYGYGFINAYAAVQAAVQAK